MRIFHRLVFQGHLNGTSGGGGNTSDATVIEEVGRVDLISISGYSTQVTGTSPTLSVYLAGSLDGLKVVVPGPPNPLVDSLSLSTTQETLFQSVGFDPSSSVIKLPYVYLLFMLGGTNPRGFFRVWVTGRDTSRRAKAFVQASMSENLSDHIHT